MVKFRYIIFLLSFFACENIEPIPNQYLITDLKKEYEGITAKNCVIRYAIKNYSKSKNESVQVLAVSKAFEIWQKTNTNVVFANSSDITRADLIIDFEETENLTNSENSLPFGIVLTKTKTISDLKQLENGLYKIQLNDDIQWTEELITRAVAFQIGNYLGFKTSDNPNSIMFPEANININKLSKEDSIFFKQKYSLPCKDLDFKSLPMSIKLTNSITEEIKLDKAGTVTIKSSGSINAGTFIGNTTPDGKFEFTYLGLAFDIDASYDIVPDFPHCAVMYKLNDDKDWKLCKSNCEFTTKGNETITLTLQINDIDPSDNSGFYTVEIDYK
ncbi:hypothetical protein EGI22_04155 [Lacihabitans sp. LS3-19]|uniref:matrixin family metalloprotease n=1 Tax=Lacihabitans sp. LS3-19 TaxID=2487335 RepID=UPI0020CC71DE|nr:matrixin family metalloprotease [Lacihabitans sp. LS3-19]MCP9767090.1 hypothetical protein [Lacihabitans sp. LS3-19]